MNLSRWQAGTVSESRHLVGPDGDSRECHRHVAFSNPGWSEGVPQAQPGEKAPTLAEVPSGTNHM